jgi:isopentenyldiphosphate isomerase
LQASSDDIWGEHEVDYILICKPEKMVRLNPNLNEVEEVRAFAPEELRAWAEGADAR